MATPLKTRKLRQQISDAIVDKYLKLDSAGNFVHPPATDEELHEFVQHAFGCTIPRKVITPGHSSPFQFLADMFFERKQNALGFANRSSGKTWTLAILDTLDMIFKPGCEICGAGSTKDQANRRYRYFQGFLRTSWFQRLNARWEELYGVPLCDPNRGSIQSRTTFHSGSLQEIITGSEKGFRGPHPHKARIDEIDEIEWNVLQMGLSMARSGEAKDGTPIRGQNIFTSTRQYTEGTMQRMLDLSTEKGIAVYEWNVWEVLEKCERRCRGDKVHGDCPIYTFCKGKAHHCEGFYQIDDFISRVRLLDRDTFATEWLNEKPAKHKMVYPMLSRQRHEMNPEKLMKMTGFSKPQESWYRIGGLDFGSSPGHPFIFLQLVQLPSGPWLLYYCYAAEQKLIRDHANAIKSSPLYFPGQIIYADWDVQDRLELKDYGVRTRKAVKGQRSVQMGIDYLCTLLNGFPPQEIPQFYIWYENCEFAWHELPKYSWPVRLDGSIDRSGNPEKKNDNVSDAIRMGLFSKKHGGVARYITRQHSKI